MMALIVETGGRLVALPLDDVAETLRPLPIESIPELPPFLLGYSCIRGEITPVVDLSLLISGERSEGIGRFVIVRCTDQLLALALTQVLGVFAIDDRQLDQSRELKILPDFVQAMSMLNSRFLWVLRCCRLVSSEEINRLLKRPEVPEGSGRAV